jgi:hypothetical protein
MALSTTPTISPSPAAGNTPNGPFPANPVNHTHPFTAITGLRFGTNGRVEPVYDAANVYANGVVVALYNAATTEGTFSAVTVPRVTISVAVQNVEGDEGNTAGKAEADKFLAEGRITKQEYTEITTTPTPKTDGVAPSAPVQGQAAAAVTGDISFATVLTPNGTTLGTMIKNVTYPRTIAQLSDHNSTVSGAQNVVNNLAALALNIYEPIKAKYSNVLVTNSFRHGKVVNGQKVPDPNQHGSGQAMDLQFRGVGAHDYFDIAVWISKNIPHDQLLLEYLPGKTVWIHISFAIPGLPYGGTSIRKSKPQNILATLNGAAGGKFTPNLHQDIIVSAVPNRVVAA